MSKFNLKSVAIATQEYEELYPNNQPTPAPTKTIKKVRNHEGAVSFALSKEMALYSQVCTSMLADKFYKSESDQMKDLRHLISVCDPKFVAKLAIYAREKMYLRSIPLVLVVELAKIHKGDDLVSKTVQRVIQRADEIAELLACYQALNGREGETKKLAKLSNQIKKGLKAVFESGKFNEYQYAKHS